MFASLGVSACFPVLEHESVRRFSAGSCIREFLAPINGFRGGGGGGGGVRAGEG